jgi:hypothetical protein
MTIFFHMEAILFPACFAAAHASAASMSLLKGIGGPAAPADNANPVTAQESQAFSGFRGPDCGWPVAVC